MVNLVNQYICICHEAPYFVSTCVLCHTLSPHFMFVLALSCKLEGMLSMQGTNVNADAGRCWGSVHGGLRQIGSLSSVCSTITLPVHSLVLFLSVAITFCYNEQHGSVSQGSAYATSRDCWGSGELSFCFVRHSGMMPLYIVIEVCCQCRGESRFDQGAVFVASA